MRDRFREAFKALTSEEGDGFVPFRWQTRLYEQLMEGRLPRAVDLPTGLGKTSVMALWLIALAEGAKLPRRLVYIVDRRAVVDQATRFAEQLRRNMPAYLAQKLQLDADSNRLPISTLRGGFADNRDWLEDPSKPAIIVGTIDMIGSRLLFEGYGVSKRMRPYHAGLLGVDALVLLDEAHLCPPFESLLRQIEAKRDGELGPRKCGNVLTPAFCVMSLSATGREMSNMPSGPVFGLVTRDYEEPLVRERLYANKRLKLTSLTENLNLADALAEKAIALGQGYPPGRVLVYCNSRRDAVEVKRLIDSECSRRRRSGEMKAGHESELLVGERRILERTALDKWLRATGFSGGCKTLPAASAFLIATSAGEVGVDLDADHMVCDLVSYERMVQRLGRVNRRGGAGRTANIVVFESQIAWKASGGKAAIERQERDRKTLLRWSAPLRHLAEGEDGCFDASPAAISEAKRRFPELVDAATLLPFILS